MLSLYFAMVPNGVHNVQGIQTREQAAFWCADYFRR